MRTAVKALAGVVALLAAAIAVVLSAPTAAAASLVQITNFGYNPTNLGMYLYVPNTVQAHPPILVAVHYCTGSGPAFYSGTQFASLADQDGFVVIYPTATRSGNSGGRGRMTCSDLANYRLRVFDPSDAQPEVKHAPMVGTYHGYTIVAAPPPASGVFLLQMLDMLEDLDDVQNVYSNAELPADAWK